MSKFLKNFKNQFTGLLGLVVVILLAAYLVYSNFSGGTVINVIRYSLPHILLGVAVIIAVIKKKHLIAFLILMIEYSSGALAFINYIIAFKFDGGFRWSLLVAFVIFVFLLLQVVSHAFDTTGSGKAPWTNVAVTIFVAFIVAFYFEKSFYGALIVLFYPIIGYIAGSPLISSLLLTQVFIESPFKLIENIQNNNNDNKVGLIVYSVFGTIFLIISIYHVIDRIKKEK
ncbi:hypothetical protein [Haploplasma axanthum]|uniref:Uncharacterized protein n=1 Tax=Haploplasma axanthum TaxID=29552 RepID=A0A449BCV4_HAPAX|nr:hypothetical protein [Haploplasma axanthum]VEU80283.1 Uncharacterised protein [Haploplasma axanthum]